MALLNLAFAQCNSNKDYKKDPIEPYAVDLPYTFKTSEAENLSVKAFDLRGGGKYGEAIRLYQQAIKIEPDNPKLFFDISECYAKSDNYPSAVLALNTAIELDSLNPSFYSNRGLYYWRQKKDVDAIADYERSIELGSTNWVTYSNLSIAYYTAERRNDACAAFKTAQSSGLTPDKISGKYLSILEKLCK